MEKTIMRLKLLGFLPFRYSQRGSLLEEGTAGRQGCSFSINRKAPTSYYRWSLRRVKTLIATRWCRHLGWPQCTRLPSCCMNLGTSDCGTAAQCGVFFVIVLSWCNTLAPLSTHYVRWSPNLQPHLNRAICIHINAPDYGHRQGWRFLVTFTT